MELEKLYFDMDGVLADFDRGVVELCGLPAIPQGKQTPEETDRLYDTMRGVPHFYGSLKPIDGAIEFFREMYEKFGDKVGILTGIPKPRRGIDEAAEDKRNWLKQYLPGDYEVNIVYRVEKPKLCTGKGCVIIDDYISNVKAWEQAGGTGILHTNFKETREKLVKLGILEK